MYFSNSKLFYIMSASNISYGRYSNFYNSLPELKLNYVLYLRKQLTVNIKTNLLVQIWTIFDSPQHLIYKLSFSTWNKKLFKLKYLDVFLYLYISKALIFQEINIETVRKMVTTLENSFFFILAQLVYLKINLLRFS